MRGTKILLISLIIFPPPKDDVIMENNCNNESLGSLGSLGSIPDIMDNSSVEEDISSCQQKDIQPCLPLFITSR